MNSQREEKDGLVFPVDGSDYSKDEDEKIAECWNSEVKQNLPRSLLLTAQCQLEGIAVNIFKICELLSRLWYTQQLCGSLESQDAVRLIESYSIAVWYY